MGKRYPDLEKVIAEKWANDGDWRFFYYRLHEKYPDLERAVAEKWANDGDERFFFWKWRLHEKYPDIVFKRR